MRFGTCMHVFRAFWINVRNNNLVTHIAEFSPATPIQCCKLVMILFAARSHDDSSIFTNIDEGEYGDIGYSLH